LDTRFTRLTRFTVRLDDVATLRRPRPPSNSSNDIVVS
jgi:hypothetical protein